MNLKNKIKNIFFNGEINTESLIISNTRHKQALYRALENCRDSFKKELRLMNILDLISIYITSAMKAFRRNNRR